MANVWLDVSAIVTSPSPRASGESETQCIGQALVCAPGEFRFCCNDTEGFRAVDAATVRDALDPSGRGIAPAAAPAPVAAAPQGLRQRARQFIDTLPAGMQPPALALARAAKRMVDGPAAEQAGAVARKPADPPFGAADVFLSFSPQWQGAAWAALRDARDRLGFRVLLPAGDVPSHDLRPLESWAASSAGRQTDGARVLQLAAVMALQGGTSFEDRLQHLYMGVLKEGDACIDIGAHTGRHTLPMSSAVGSGRVAAFEPNPTVAQWLRARLAQFAVTNVTVHELALSDETGDAEFVIALDLLEESGLKERVYNGPTRVERVPVRLEQLDNLDLGSPRFIKLDTEGAEYKVLLGARETVARARPVVAFEFGLKSYGAYGVDPNDVFTYFQSLDYDVHSIHGQRLAQAEFAEASRVQAYWDYVACHSSESARIAAVLLSFGR